MRSFSFIAIFALLSVNAFGAHRYIAGDLVLGNKGSISTYNNPLEFRVPNTSSAANAFCFAENSANCRTTRASAGPQGASIIAKDSGGTMYLTLYGGDNAYVSSVRAIDGTEMAYFQLGNATAFSNVHASFPVLDFNAITGQTQNISSFKVGGTTKAAITADGYLELGHATDTTFSRTNAGRAAIEGKEIYTSGGSIDVAPADGGLGISTVPSNGYIPIGNGTNYTAAAITAGSGITVTNGAGSITIAASGSGKMILLGCATASSSSSLDFTSLIDASNYSYYKLVIDELTAGSNPNIVLLASTDNGSNWTAELRGQRWDLTMASTTAPSYTSLASSTTGVNFTTNGGAMLIGWIDINLTDGGTSNVAIFEASTTYSTQYGRAFIVSAGTTAINAVRIAPASGTFGAGKACLYGLKDN